MGNAGNFIRQGISANWQGFAWRDCRFRQCRRQRLRLARQDRVEIRRDRLDRVGVGGNANLLMRQIVLPGRDRRPRGDHPGGLIRSRGAQVKLFKINNLIAIPALYGQFLLQHTVKAVANPLIDHRNFLHVERQRANIGKHYVHVLIQSVPVAQPVCAALPELNASSVPVF